MNEYKPAPDPEMAKRLGLGEKQGLGGKPEGEQPRSFWRRNRLPIAGVAVVALVALSWIFSSSGTKTTYTAEAATRGSLTVTVSATGTLKPQNQVDVGAEISGRVDTVNVDFNDHVTKGEILAVINTEQARAQLAQSEATLANSRATVTNNQATVTQTLAKRDRYKQLYDKGGVSAQDLQAAEADYQRAVASVKQAQANVDNAEADVTVKKTSLSKAEVSSPIDGVVIDRQISAGQTVAASLQTPVLFTLASDLSKMKLEIDIDEADIGSVKEGQSATFTVDAFSGREFDAKLVSLHNAVKSVNGVVTYPGVLEVNNPDGVLRPGLTANATIVVAKLDNALLVPNGALRFVPPQGATGAAPATSTASTAPAVKQDGKTESGKAGHIWVLKNGKPEPRDVTTGLSNGQYTEIRSGNLQAGEQVITNTATSAGGRG
jgi:HlyD family secretion protein